MKKLFILLLIPFTVLGQNPLKQIKDPESKEAKKCKKYYQVYRKLPIEIRYNVELIEGNIMFHFNSEEAFKKIFNKKFDGFAIDIVSRDQYNCSEGNTLSDSEVHKGYLLPPLFRKELKQRMIVDVNQNIIINCGKLPAQFDASSVECNMVLLQKKYKCGYHEFTNIDYNQWQLLDMGLYRDTLDASKLEELRLTKVLSFEVPFEKNKYDYLPEDLKSLYDSLHLTDYYVKSINIEALTSVEGNNTVNYTLQNARALSIVEGLQRYQKPEITFAIKASENWPDFYRDTKNTTYRHLHYLPKDSIKLALETLEHEPEMHDILSAHRKAKIELTVERKTVLDNNTEKLVTLFGQSIENNQIYDAMYIQNHVFDQINKINCQKHF